VTARQLARDMKNQAGHRNDAARLSKTKTNAEFLKLIAR
jgi:hypothetical protein